MHYMENDPRLHPNQPVPTPNMTLHLPQASRRKDMILSLLVLTLALFTLQLCFMSLHMCCI